MYCACNQCCSQEEEDCCSSSDSQLENFIPSNCTNNKPIIKGKFGLAYIVQTEKQKCCQPLGWQVEFKDTPSKINSNCRKMVKWVNCPPLGNCCNNNNFQSNCCEYPKKCAEMLIGTTCKQPCCCTRQCCIDTEEACVQSCCCKRMKSKNCTNRCRCCSCCNNKHCNQKNNKKCCCSCFKEEINKCFCDEKNTPCCCCSRPKCNKCCLRGGNNIIDDNLDYIPKRDITVINTTKTVKDSHTQSKPTRSSINENNKTMVDRKHNHHHSKNKQQEKEKSQPQFTSTPVTSAERRNNNNNNNNGDNDDNRTKMDNLDNTNNVSQAEKSNNDTTSNYDKTKDSMTADDRTNRSNETTREQEITNEESTNYRTTNQDTNKNNNNETEMINILYEKTSGDLTKSIDNQDMFESTKTTNWPEYSAADNNSDNTKNQTEFKSLSLPMGDTKNDNNTNSIKRSTSYDNLTPLQKIRKAREHQKHAIEDSRNKNHESNMEEMGTKLNMMNETT